MLKDLHIENIAVIERTDVEFSPGLNILTGETGAGKSIVIDALDAVLGGRVSRTLVRSGAEKAVVTAVFTSDNALDWCMENDIEPEGDELILQRRISADGKSSCRVCGVPVTAAQLRELGSFLLDIHGQNDGRQLMDEARHREYLDRFAGLLPELEAYAEQYRAWQSIAAEMERLTMDEAEKEYRTERLRAALSELESAELAEGEEAALEARRELLKNAGRLTEALDESYTLLYAAEDSAISLSSEAGDLLDRAQAWAPSLGEAARLVTDARYLLEDAAERVRETRAELDFSPEEYDRLESRLSTLRKLRKKYGRDEAELLAYMEECRAQLDDLEYADDRLLRLEKDLAAAEARVRKEAKVLREKRAAAAAELQKRIEAELAALRMPSVRFEAEILPLSGKPGFDRHGDCEVRFLMSANAGEKPGRIAQIASGGELSRIMLAMKSVFAQKDPVPAMVFDEIDTGVSGIAAQRVGEKLGDLAAHRQVLCVTHLPQIAAMADAHYAIEKSETGGRTFTKVFPLDREGRVREIARLQSGENPTAAMLESAKELLRASETRKSGGTPEE
ncbi:MAG: DNA repair protein RecN [Ruminococcaceae bacterium]|nr:DNA repair protein RecN [Oscillospiraceae bacterium]